MRVKSPLRVELTAEERAELEHRSRALGARLSTAV
jgi:hypothetical protein